MWPIELQNFEMNAYYLLAIKNFNFYFFIAEKLIIFLFMHINLQKKLIFLEIFLCRNKS